MFSVLFSGRVVVLVLLGVLCGSVVFFSISSCVGVLVRFCRVVCSVLVCVVVLFVLCSVLLNMCSCFVSCVWWVVSLVCWCRWVISLVVF